MTKKFFDYKENLASGPIPIDCESPFDEVAVNRVVITSPNYPNEYENNKDCQLTIRVASDQLVNIFVEAFNAESHSTCGYDYLASSTLVATRGII